jgi:hypothetical protein
MITEKINQIEKLITVPNVDKDSDGANNAMKILIHLTELRGLVDSAFLPSVMVVFMDSYGNAINIGDNIIIDSDYNYQHNNGAEAEVLWDEKKGVFKYKITNKFPNHQSDFYGIHKFRKMNP